jgi:hypothetical protein
LNGSGAFSDIRSDEAALDGLLNRTYDDAMIDVITSANARARRRIVAVWADVCV